MTLFGNPDQFIVESLSEGKNVEKATTKLYDLYWAKLVEFIVAKGAKPDNAGDYAQESILRLLDRIQKNGFDLDRRGGLKTYLFAIAKYYTWDQLRKDSRTTDAESEFMGRGEDSPYDHIEASEWQTAERDSSAWEKFERLGELCRKLLLLFLDGRNAGEVFEELGFSSPTHLRVQKKRCLDKLLKQ